MTMKDVEERTGLSRSNIRFYENKNSLSLQEMKVILKSQIIDLNRVKFMCEKMLYEENISYER